MDHEALHRRARERGVNIRLYWLVRCLLQPCFHVYLRLARTGREHIPADGPVIIAANHRSFLDPFVIGTMARRPMYYMAKREIFAKGWLSWLLGALGAFPVDRGANDGESIATAKALLARGEIVLIFPEGTRIRPGALGRPRRGVGRLAVESGAPVVPVAVIGTEDVRRGWRLRPRKVRIRAGRPLRFPHVEPASHALAGAVTDRIWPCVMLQWEWLGGLPPIRRAAIIGAGSFGTSLAVCLARAGFEVELGCRTREQAQILGRERTNSAYLPGVELPDSVRVTRAANLALERHDLVCLAVPARALPSVIAAHGERIPRRAGVLVLARGLVPPLGTLPSAYVSERCGARAVAVLGGPADAGQMLDHGASAVIGSLDRGLARQLADAFRVAGLHVSRSADVIGVELAGCAAHAAALAAAAASRLGPSLAGTAAAKVFAEVDALARVRGAGPETFAGLAGSGELLQSVLAEHSGERRAGELLAQGVPAAEIGRALGPAAGAVESVPLLATAARDSRLETPALDRLAALVQGHIAPGRWIETVGEPARARGSRPVRAA
ncbi:MAG: 1-acyl-sn-glycerol-3-phosphate acyltransferase [Solirubrobacterales bacterium]|nr:1-acyl-sn-glycerol-3-phosphate acyltransferase [Solirubrobacterales bacterium]